MNTKIKIWILTFAIACSIILSIFGLTGTTWFSQTALWRQYASALAQSNSLPTAEPVILTAEQGQYPLGLNLEILEDPAGELTIEDVSSPSFATQFLPSKVAVPNFGFTTSTYWVRLNVDNQTSQNSEWLLEQGFANTHYVDLFTPLPQDEGYSVKQTGVLRSVKNRDVHHPRIIFKLTIPPQSQQTYYLRFNNGASMTLPLTLWTTAAFWDHSLLEQTLIGIFYGVLFGLLFYNLFLFFFLREASYLFFTILLASLIIELATYDGYLMLFTSSKLIFLNRYYQPLAFMLVIASIVLFADTFLRLKERAKKFHTAHLLVLAGWGGLLLLAPFTSYHFIANLIVPWAAISVITVLAAGFASWKSGFLPARFFLIAWIGMLASILWILLIRLGAAPSTLLNENVHRLGIVWMVVFWSIALADRINLLKAETESANLALSESEHRLTETLDGLPLGVVVYSKDFKPNYVNRSAITILQNPDRGIQPELTAGRTLVQAINYYSLKVSGSDELYPLEKFPVFSALNGEQAFADDIEIDQGETRLPLEIIASPVRDGSGNVESAVVAFRDISQRKRAERALQISERRFRIIAENNFDGILFIDRDRRILYVSPSYTKLIGRTPDELIGQIGTGFVYPEDREHTAEKIKELLQHPGTRITAEYRLQHRDGSLVWIETYGINLLDDPDIQAIVLNSHDITERKQTEAELDEYRKDLESLVGRRTAVLIAVNEWLTAMNQVHQTIGGIKDLPQADQNLLRTISSCFDTKLVFILRWNDQGEQPIICCSSQLDNPPPDLLESIQAAFDTDSPLRLQTGAGETIQISADQAAYLPLKMQEFFQEHGIQSLIVEPMINRRATVGVLGVAWRVPLSEIDIQNLVLIQKMALNLADLAQDAIHLDNTLILATTLERNRLARELHDSVTQTLFTSSVLAEATPRIWERDPHVARQNLDKLSLLIRGALAEMRALLLELRSGELQNQTLSQLLATLAEAGRVRTRAAISISITGDRTLPDKVTLAFYRIAQEAVNNAINHARANEINISLLAQPDVVKLRIRDDGSGFELQAIPESHLGIRIMLERAAQIEADLQIHSKPGHGTEITLTWSGQ